MNKIIEAMVRVAKEGGVQFRLGEAVEEITIKNGIAKSVKTNKGVIESDLVVAAADYHHVDQQLVNGTHKNYSPQYWDNRAMAPSSLIFYLGIGKKLKGLEHHNLFFDKDFNLHADEIYTNPKWPTDPLFYVCAPSKTDENVAPEGCENIFILIPVAPGLQDNNETREKYYELVLNRMEQLAGQSIKDHVVFKRSYAHNDFMSDYNAFKGNAYGLANTLMQTAFLKPKIRSKKVDNLYYTGQLTVPGPGVPPSIISGQVVAQELKKNHPNT
jgi:phytoene desaturase